MEFTKEQIEKRKSKLKGLLTKHDDAGLTLKAIASLEREQKAKSVDLEDVFCNKAETLHAQDLLEKYLKDYSIESISDRNTLKQLIYLEIINFRLQNALNDAYKTNNRLDKETLELIHKNQDKIIALKDKLGLNRDKSTDSVKDGYGYLQLIKKKFKVWLQENQASRTICCPYCSKLVYLKIKTDAWEAQRHPFFADRLLSNKHLMRLYVQGKLSKEDLAKVFDTSSDYITWLLDRWKSNPDYKDFVKLNNMEDINEKTR